MKTDNYTERHTFTKYDDEHHLLYLNEEKASWIIHQYGNNMELSGYSYTGDMPDGSTIIKVKDVTDENRRDKYIAGLITKTYSIDEQLAIIVNGKDTDKHVQELCVFELFRAKCKQAVDELLNR